MTAQINDSIAYKNEEFSLVGISGGDLFKPQAFDLHPGRYTSACYRGYQCTYIIDNQSLLLKKLFIALSSESPPSLNDVEPYKLQPSWESSENVVRAKIDTDKVDRRLGSTQQKDGDAIERERREALMRRVRAILLPTAYIYENINLPVDFTGGLLLGRDFIKDLYVHMGFHPAWKYREVHELIFENGILQSQKDCSEDLKQVRLNLAGKDRPTSNSDDDVKRWISDCFSLKYTR